MQHFTALLIDDDEPTNVYNNIMLKKSENISFWKIVNSADSALDYLSTISYAPDIILLDLNMPIHSGWDFLDYYERLDLPKKCKNVCILTTSLGSQDREKSKNYHIVKGFEEKPLTVNSLNKFIESVKQ